MNDQQILERAAELVSDINQTLFTVNPTMTYQEVLGAFIELARLVKAYEGDGFENFELWNIGEHGGSTLDDTLVGAYWHLTQWHGGQDSLSYAAMCAISDVFKPWCSCEPEEGENEYDSFEALERLASEEARG